LTREGHPGYILAWESLVKSEKSGVMAPICSALRKRDEEEIKQRDSLSGRRNSVDTARRCNYANGLMPRPVFGITGLPLLFHISHLTRCSPQVFVCPWSGEDTRILPSSGRWNSCEHPILIIPDPGGSSSHQRVKATNMASSYWNDIANPALPLGKRRINLSLRASHSISHNT
jgi:hypothetical protein